MQILPSGSNIGDSFAAIEVSDTTAFVVFEASGQRLVQQPVSRIALFVWQLQGPSIRTDFTARSYDSDGRALACIASGTNSC